jgi:hypothetical protein
VKTWSAGPGSSAGIATDYGLNGPGIESRWGEIFRTCPDRPWGPPSLLYDGHRIFSGVESGRGVTRGLKIQSSAIPLLSLRAFEVCKKGETYLTWSTKAKFGDVWTTA